MASTSTSTSPSSPPGRPSAQHGLVALDWHSGNRSVLVDHELSGLVVGQTLATRAEDTYRALLEATAFGTRTIVEAFVDSGVPVTELVVAGGLLKNPLLMQIYADVTNLPLSTITSEQGPALGSAIHAAVAAGAYADVHAAAEVMGRSQRGVYQPIPANVRGVRRTVRRVQHCCTTTSDAAPTTSCTGSGASAGPPPVRRRQGHGDRCGCPAKSMTRPTRQRRCRHDRHRRRARHRPSLRSELAELHRELTRYGLVIWTAGNVSARVPGATCW